MEEIKPPTGDKGTILNLHTVACNNQFYRKEIWTGENLQVTIMSIPIGGEIGLEMHENFDQLLYVEYGLAAVYMGPNKQGVRLVGNVSPTCAVLIPAGTYHNVINDHDVPLKLFSVYAPPHHPKGTTHKTKFDSDLADY